MFTDEISYRLTILAFLGVGIGLALRYRRRADVVGGRVSRRHEGPLLAISLRAVGLSFYLLILAYLINPDWIAWARLGIPDPLRWGGAMAVAAAIAWVGRVLHHLGLNVTDTVVVRPNATLVTTGPYRWIRHPLYPTILLMGVGFSLLTASWFFAAAAVVAFILLVRRTRTEELHLLQAFGDEYRTYMARTGRFLPTRRKR